jgi:predicted acyl esterase
MTNENPLDLAVLPRRRVKPADAPDNNYPGLNPRTEIIPQGTVLHGGRALRASIRIDRDVAIPLRDGAIVYADIFTPEECDAALPVIMSWSPYGKQDYGALLDHIPGRAGIARDDLSNLQKWEGADPDYWCAHGYAVVNVDPRGVNSSSGDIKFFGEAEGQDAADVIEWLGTRPWSNGKVGMSGNSWLAIVQWFAAAKRPPHLAAIAPWEGASDYYRNMALRGGIPTGDAFVDWNLSFHFHGSGTVEDVPKIIAEYQLWNDYWQSKRAAIEEIAVPAYVVASWTGLHSSGTLDAFRRLRSESWLRVHNNHEWPDYYRPENTEDLRKFFDHFLLNVDNGWEATPRVRLSVLDPGGVDVIDRPESEWPLARATHKVFHLGTMPGLLVEQAPESESIIEYPAEDGAVVLTLEFDSDSEIIGYSNLRLWVEAIGSDDMDIFVRIDKIDRDGTLVAPLVLGEPSLCTSGQIRVSHRAKDDSRSTDAEPFLSHQTEELLAAGEIVPVDIGLWATAVRFHSGEKLQLTISGVRIIPTELGKESTIPLRNRGRHIIHTGGAYASYLLLPFVE